MAGTTTHPVAFRNTVADLVDSSINAGGPGLLQFRTSGTADSRGTVAATLTFSATAFGAASSGVITADTITSDTSAAGGIVATATLDTGAGTTIVHTTVAASGDAINLSGGLTIGAGDTVACSALTYAAMP
ncbi:MAG: hypothetical protein IPG77_01895 [Betaproteobacteria bacterium]|nr:hypothetical protein [Betaproteobacteria bacterium]